jgi:hypothetical protein
VTRPNRHLYRLFVDLISVRVLNPSVVADSSQVLGQTQCVFRVVRMYLRAAARTFRLRGSHLTLRITDGLGCLCLTQDEGAGL